VNESRQDGRIVLDKDMLKQLRRSLGASQEKVAFLCAEQGLCVSVASLKRAETSKNILYRTARDIARFYEVAVESLAVGQRSESDTKSIVTPDQNTHALQEITVRHSFVSVSCELYQERDQQRVACQEFAPIFAQIAPQYSAHSHAQESHTLFFTFGLEHTRGNEARRAIEFGKHCLQLVRTLWGDSRTCKIVLVQSAVVCGSERGDFRAQGLEQIDPCSHERLSTLTGCAPYDVLCGSEELKFALPPTWTCGFSSKDQHSANTENYWWVKSYSAADSAKASYPIVGRKVEITLFKAVLESAREYQSLQVVHLIGAAGIGKSRLTEEFHRIAGIDEFECHQTHMFDFHVEQQLQAIPVLLRSLLNVARHESALTLEEINHRSGNVVLQETTHLPLLYSLLNWKIPQRWTALFSAMSPEKLFQSQCQVLVNILVAKAERKPVLLLLEDYHWAELREREFFAAISTYLVNSPIVMLFSTRPGSVVSSATDIAPGAALTSINLGPLAQRDAETVSQHFPKASDSYRQQCVDKAQGNPLFLTQLLSEGDASFERELPFSLQNLIASRVDNMQHRDQLAACAASVIGRHFSLDLLRELIAQPDYQPTALIQSNVVNGVDNEYAFNHALIAEGIYQSIAVADRDRLHVACAQWYSDDAVMQCHHLLKGRHVGAVDQLVPAMRFLMSRYQFEQAKDLAEVGLAEMEQLACSQLFHELRADVYFRLGDIQAALGAYNLMLVHAVDEEGRASAFIGKANCLNTLDDFDSAMAALGEAESLAVASNLITQLSRVFYLRGNFLFPKGEAQACIDAQEKALYYARKSDNAELEARALGGLGDAAYASGKMTSAHEYFSQCLALSDRYDLKAVSAANMFMMGTVRIYLCETEQALADVERSITIAEMVGHKRAEVVSRLTASWILIDGLRFVEARSHINTAIELAREIGAQRFIPFLIESESRCAYLAGDVTGGKVLIDRGIALMRELGAHTFIGPWLLATRALMSASLEEAQGFLSEGEGILTAGCVGHNYYRFYVAAIEVGIIFKDRDIIDTNIECIRAYSSSEQCPWSDFYMRRGHAIRNALFDIPADPTASSLESLIEQAQQAQLLSAIPALKSVI